MAVMASSLLLASLLGAPAAMAGTAQNDHTPYLGTPNSSPLFPFATPCLSLCKLGRTTLAWIYGETDKRWDRIQIEPEISLEPPLANLVPSEAAKNNIPRSRPLSPVGGIGAGIATGVIFQELRARCISKMGLPAHQPTGFQTIQMMLQSLLAGLSIGGLVMLGEVSLRIFYAN
jgi:hypothetical protein